MNLISNIFNAILLLILPLLCWDPFLQFKLSNTRFDFIIVGAGSAGSVVASRLSENPSVNVLLLEAGGCPSIFSDIPAAAILLQQTGVDWQFKVVPQNESYLSYTNHQLNYAQGKMLGGTSSLNDMMYVRGNTWDYDNWEQLGNIGWGYNDVLPFFLKSEGNRVPGEENDTTYHNTKGPQTVSRAPYKTPALDTFLKSGEELGYSVVDINAKQQEGFSPNVYTMKDGNRWSTNNAYLQPAKSRPNLIIATNCFVTKVLFDSQKRAIGVEYINNDIKYTVKASKEVILSAGALLSPKILKLSGVGPAQELQKFKIPVVVDLPGVGENLHDHVACIALTWSVNCSQCTYNFDNSLSLGSIASWVLLRDGPLTVNYGNEATSFVKTSFSKNSNAPDVQIVLVSIDLPTAINVLAPKLGMSLPEVNQYFGPIANVPSFTLLVINNQPESRGHILLQSSDPLQPPLIDFRFLTQEIDAQRLVLGMKIAMQLGNSKAFAAFGAKLNPTVVPGCETFQQFSDAYLECVARHINFPTYHAGGTCKMGVASDKMAVVDANLNVYNVIGLRVIDASIMPRVISGNTNAPAIMIGEKGADAIKKAYGWA